MGALWFKWRSGFKPIWVQTVGQGRRLDDIDITIDIALDKTYFNLSSSVNGLLVEDITKVEGPCQSVLANNI
jgi:hypothetical protein